MNRSTVIMTCNYSGYLSDDALEKVARFGIVDLDWNNAKGIWSQNKPMTVQESLLIQAKAIKKVNPSTYVWVYRLSRHLKYIYIHEHIHIYIIFQTAI